MSYTKSSIAALFAAAFLCLAGCGERGANTGQTDDSGMSDTAPGTAGDTGTTGTPGATPDATGDGTAGGAYDDTTGADQSGDMSGDATGDAGAGATTQDEATSTPPSDTAGESTPPQQ